MSPQKGDSCKTQPVAASKWGGLVLVSEHTHTNSRMYGSLCRASSHPGVCQTPGFRGLCWGQTHSPLSLWHVQNGPIKLHSSPVCKREVARRRIIIFGTDATWTEPSSSLSLFPSTGFDIKHCITGGVGSQRLHSQVQTTDLICFWKIARPSGWCLDCVICERGKTPGDRKHTVDR